MLTEPYNQWIFFALNSIYLISTFLQFWIIQLTLEKYNIMEDDILGVWNDLRFYLWNPNSRLELEIEGWALIAKEFVIICNFFIYW